MEITTISNINNKNNHNFTNDNVNIYSKRYNNKSRKVSYDNFINPYDGYGSERKSKLKEN